MLSAQKTPALKDVLHKALQAAGGSLPVADFMHLVLHDPMYGYYRNTLQIGRAGDFVTAPHLTSLFGQVVGAYLLAAWERAGQPAAIDLIELGAGQGLLITDIVKVFQQSAIFTADLTIKCLELNPYFRQEIQTRLHPMPVQFYENSGGLLMADRPAFILSNEFLDALPVHQFIAKGGEWFERNIALVNNNIEFQRDEKSSLSAFVSQYQLPNFLMNEQAPDNTIFEICPTAYHLNTQIAKHIADYGGCALHIDYGTIQPGFGNTLQAIKNHQMITLDQLVEDGGGDLTTHVDFYRLGKSSAVYSSLSQTLMTQRDFLLQGGIMQRALQAKGCLSREQLLAMDAVLHRLTSPQQMGTLFKAYMIEKRN